MSNQCSGIELQVSNDGLMEIKCEYVHTRIELYFNPLRVIIYAISKIIGHFELPATKRKLYKGISITIKQ